MIGSLRGTIVDKSIDETLLEVGGVGYRVQIPLSTYEALPAVSEEAHLVTYLHVRDDELTLYGFAAAGERALFETLLSVGGVGPKLALHALSSLTPERFVRAIRTQDLATLTGISGVGKKTAERLVLELKDKLDEVGELGPAEEGPPLSTQGEDAVKALIALGIRRSAAQPAVRQALADEPDAPAPVLTRLALSAINDGGGR